MPYLEIPPSLLWLVLAWLFAVGGCIGSFMNVVIYRLPAGLSLLHPPSHCPACKTPIPPTDNVPIFGWLWLRGRCRNCRATISPRYPAVKLLVALLFVGLACVEPLSGGGNLPLPAFRSPTPELWGIYAYHLFLLCSLICAAFTEWDGHRLTWRLALPGLAVGLLAPLAWPHLRPTLETRALPSWIALMDGIFGAAAGGLLGLAVSVALATKARLSAAPGKTCPRPRPQLDFPRTDAAIALAWVGAFLGWPAAVAVALASVATSSLLAQVISRLAPALDRLVPLSHLAAWTLIWIILWRQIDLLFAYR